MPIEEVFFQANSQQVGVFKNFIKILFFGLDRLEEFFFSTKKITTSEATESNLMSVTVMLLLLLLRRLQDSQKTSFDEI